MKNTKQCVKIQNSSFSVSHGCAYRVVHTCKYSSSLCIDILGKGCLNSLQLRFSKDEYRNFYAVVNSFDSSYSTSHFAPCCCLCFCMKIPTFFRVPDPILTYDWLPHMYAVASQKDATPYHTNTENRITE